MSTIKKKNIMMASMNMFLLMSLRMEPQNGTVPHPDKKEDLSSRLPQPNPSMEMTKNENTYDLSTMRLQSRTDKNKLFSQQKNLKELQPATSTTAFHLKHR